MHTLKTVTKTLYYNKYPLVNQALCIYSTRDTIIKALEKGNGGEVALDLKERLYMFSSINITPIIIHVYIP